MDKTLKRNHDWVLKRVHDLVDKEYEGDAYSLVQEFNSLSWLILFTNFFDGLSIESNVCIKILQMKSFGAYSTVASVINKEICSYLLSSGYFALNSASQNH